MSVTAGRLSEYLTVRIGWVPYGSLLQPPFPWVEKILFTTHYTIGSSLS